MRAFRGSYTRGGRGGSLQCNIPSHMIGERIAESANDQDRRRDSQELLEAQLAGNRMRMARVSQAKHAASLNRRRAAALALGAATIAVATRALPRSRAFPKFRVAKRAPRSPKVVGIPRSRTRTTAGSRRGIKGGAFRFPRFADFPRRRRTTRRDQRALLTGPRSGGAQFITEEGL